jgi:hypothetical protein
MYAVTLNKLKTVLKASAQAGQSGIVNKFSVESTAHDEGFYEMKRRKRYISNNTSQTTKMSTKLGPKSAGLKLPPKSASTRNYFAPLRTTDMDTETTGAENTPSEQEAPRKSGNLHQQ